MGFEANGNVSLVTFYVCLKWQLSCLWFRSIVLYCDWCYFVSLAKFMSIHCLSALARFPNNTTLQSRKCDREYLWRQLKHCSDRDWYLNCPTNNCFTDALRALSSLMFLICDWESPAPHLSFILTSFCDLPQCKNIQGDLWLGKETLYLWCFGKGQEDWSQNCHRSFVWSIVVVTVRSALPHAPPPITVSRKNGRDPIRWRRWNSIRFIFLTSYWYSNY